MQTHDAARAAGTRHCEEMVFPSSLSNHVVQAAAEPLNRSASNQRGQVSWSQSEVPYLVRPKVRGNALYPEPVENVSAQAMQSIEIKLGEAIECFSARMMQNVHVPLRHVDILHYAAKGRYTNSLRVWRQSRSGSGQLLLCASCHFFTAAMVFSTC